MKSPKREIISEYNQNSYLTRAGLSYSWGIGLFAGMITTTFNASARHNILEQERSAQEKVKNSYAPEKLISKKESDSFWLNNSAYLAGASLVLLNSLIKASPVLIASSNVISAIFPFAIAADGLGIGTGKSFGAMRAGYAHGKLMPINIGKKDQDTPKLN